MDLEIVFSKRCELQIRSILRTLPNNFDISAVFADYGINITDHLLATHQSSTIKGMSSLMGLPYACFSALSDDLEIIDPIAGLWGTNYLAIHLLDKIEDQELDLSKMSSRDKAPLINLSIALIVACLNIMDDHKICPDENKRQIIRSRIIATLMQMASGQHLDLINHATNIDQCWNIIRDKSGSFFALGCYLGAIMATDDQETIQGFQQYGFHLGILIQLANDFVGLLQKDGFCDISTGKNTLPIIYARQFYAKRNIGTFNQILEQAKVSLDAEKLVRKMIFESEAIIYMLLEAEKHKKAALSAIGNIHFELRNIDLLSQYVDKAFSPYEIDSSSINR